MKKKSLFCYLVIFLFTFTYFFFLGNDNYLVADDTIFHTSNILVMANEISFSNLVPGKIMPTLVNNLGYGVNLFYPIFPHLVGAYLVKILGLFDIGIADVMKFMHFMVIFLAGVFMYKYIMEVFQNRKQALVTAILYQSMPYLFTDVFMRGALNESFIFIYLPIIFLGFHYLFEKDDSNKFYIYFIVGYSLLIYSHLVLAVYLTLLLIPFLLVYYKKLFTKRIIRKLIIGSGLILLITSNFWGPMLEHYFLDNYYIFSLVYDGITSKVEIIPVLYYFFPSRFRYSTSVEGYFLSFNIIPVCLFLIIYNCIFGNKNKVDVKHKKVLIGFCLFLGISLLFGSSSLLWKFMPKLLKNIQFGWRLALFVAFGAAVIGGYGIRRFRGKLQIFMMAFVICLCACSNYMLSSELNYVDTDEIVFLRNSCCHLQWSYEYLPVVAKYNSLELYSKNDDLGNNVRIVWNEVPDMKFEVFDITDELTIEFPRIYYLGYELRNEDGEKVELYQNSFGLLEAVVNENGVYYLEYRGTLIDRVTRVLSIGTIISCSVYLIFLGVRKKKCSS